MTRKKSPRLVQIGRELGRANLEEKGIAYFKENGKKSAEVRKSKFATPQEEKAYYAELGRKSAQTRKIKKERAAAREEEKRIKLVEEERKRRHPLHIINNFLSGKTRS